MTYKGLKERLSAPVDEGALVEKFLLQYSEVERPKLIFVDGDKGGVGKSFLARALAHTMLNRGLDVLGIDADARNAHLHRYYAATIPVTRIYLRERAGWDQLIDTLDNVDNGTDVLVDLPANIGEVLKKEAPRLFQACEDLGRDVHRAWVMGSEYDSVAQLSDTKDLLPPSQTTVFFNGLYGEREEFSLWNGSGLRAHFYPDFDAHPDPEIYLPKMAAPLRSLISSERCSFTRAAKLQLPRSSRIDLDCWLSQTEAAFAPFLARLGV